mmetsp:Transcript_11109/g.19367  ORF Transcript_11109/g.19367 Transcript_11109/m.19367 type:complete len:245 (+) Transcript_11109:305-1039(+)
MPCGPTRYMQANALHAVIEVRPLSETGEKSSPAGNPSLPYSGGNTAALGMIPRSSTACSRPWPTGNTDCDLSLPSAQQVGEFAGLLGGNGWPTTGQPIPLQQVVVTDGIRAIAMHCQGWATLEQVRHKIVDVTGCDRLNHLCILVPTDALAIGEPLAADVLCTGGLALQGIANGGQCGALGTLHLLHAQRPGGELHLTAHDIQHCLSLAGLTHGLNAHHASAIECCVECRAAVHPVVVVENTRV